MEDMIKRNTKMEGTIESIWNHKELRLVAIIKCTIK
jgi:hypothetical protein